MNLIKKIFDWITKDINNMRIMVIITGIFIYIFYSISKYQQDTALIKTILMKTLMFFGTLFLIFLIIASFIEIYKKIVRKSEYNFQSNHKIMFFATFILLIGVSYLISEQIEILNFYGTVLSLLLIGFSMSIIFILGIPIK